MAETPPKRNREESLIKDSSSEFDDSSANSKRQRPYNSILNLLDEEEEQEPSQEPSHELSQDLSAIFTTLQQELSSSTSCDSSTTTTTTLDFESLPSTEALEAAQLSLHQTTSAVCGGGGDEDKSVKSVMRHLLEASDDELGIPNTRDEINVVEGLDSGENLPCAFDDNGLWEIEDEAANYYTVLQSELFM